MPPSYNTGLYEPCYVGRGTAGGKRAIGGNCRYQGFGCYFTYIRKCSSSFLPPMAKNLISFKVILNFMGLNIIFQVEGGIMHSTYISKYGLYELNGPVGDVRGQVSDEVIDDGDY